MRPTEIRFFDHVIAPADMTGYALTGALKPARIWLNGELITGNTLKLKAGANPLVLQYYETRAHLLCGLAHAGRPAKTGRIPHARWPVAIRGGRPGDELVEEPECVAI